MTTALALMTLIAVVLAFKLRRAQQHTTRVIELLARHAPVVIPARKDSEL